MRGILSVFLGLFLLLAVACYYVVIYGIAVAILILLQITAGVRWLWRLQKGTLSSDGTRPPDLAGAPRPYMSPVNRKE